MNGQQNRGARLLREASTTEVEPDVLSWIKGNPAGQFEPRLTRVGKAQKLNSHHAGFFRDPTTSKFVVQLEGWYTVVPGVVDEEWEIIDGSNGSIVEVCASVAEIRVSVQRLERGRKSYSLTLTIGDELKVEIGEVRSSGIRPVSSAPCKLRETYSFGNAPGLVNLRGVERIGNPITGFPRLGEIGFVRLTVDDVVDSYPADTVMLHLGDSYFPLPVRTRWSMCFSDRQCFEHLEIQGNVVTVTVLVYVSGEVCKCARLSVDLSTDATDDSVPRIDPALVNLVMGPRIEALDWSTLVGPPLPDPLFAAPVGPPSVPLEV